MDVEKSCPVIPNGLRVGQQIAYTVTIENTGDTALTGLAVVESRTGTFSPELPTTLAVGATYTGTFTTAVTQADANAGKISNTITVNTAQGATDTDTANCPFTPVKGIEIEKNCPTIPAGARVGASISYLVTIENTGDIALTGVVVTDSRAGSFDSAFPTTLNPGQTASRTFTSTITAQDALNGHVNNTASVSTTQGASDSATATCPFNPVESVKITKTCPVIPAGARVGASISYTVTIENTGDVPLTNVSVSDTRTGSFDEAFPATLARGASVTRTFISTITAQDALNGNVNNTASVTANANGVAVSDQAIATCPFNPVEGIDISKSCPTIPANARIGAAISYIITIENTGDTPVSNIVVTETRTGTLDQAFPTTLNPGQIVSRTFTSAITALDAVNGNVNNTATVTGSAVSVAVSDEAVATCPFNPVEGVEITKSCPVVPADARVGDEISYQITIRNTGDVPLSNVLVTETRAGSLNAAFPTTLGVNQSETRTFTSTITPDDVTNGNVNNTATVTADALQVPVTDEAVAECPFNPVEGIEITKSCPVIPAGARVGASISYTVTVRNTGDVTLTTVVVTETRTGTLNEPFPTELAAGASATRTFTSTITLADAANGHVNNTASVTASALGVAVNDSAKAYCPFNPVESIEITKS